MCDLSVTTWRSGLSLSCHLFISLAEDWKKGLIYNRNGTAGSPTRSVIIRVINKIGRLRGGSLICQLPV